MTAISSSMGQIVLALLTVLCILGPCAYAARLYPGTLAVRATVCFLLSWTVLAAAAYLLACFGLLGNAWLFWVASAGFSSAGALAFRRVAGGMPPLPTDRAGDGADRLGTLLAGAGLAVVALAMVGTLLLAAFAYPNNDDSLTYRFARVMLYIGKGDLLPFGDVDPRLATYPLCGVFLYLIPGLWALDGRFFTLVGVACWLAGGVAVVAAARELGTSRRAALIAAALYLTAPAVLVSAASTNDDMIAGVPLLAAVLFVLRWWRSRRMLDAVLVGIGVGLSVGTKFHILLYDLTILLALLAILLRFPALALRTIGAHWRQLLASVAVAGFFTVPGLMINRLVAGAFLPTPSNPALSPFTGITNSPFSLVTAAANVAITMGQLLFGDIPNQLFSATGPERLAFLHRFNAFFTDHLFWWLSDDLNYRIPYYRFRGVAATDPGTGSWEQSVTLGLLPWLAMAILAVGLALWRRRAGAMVACWLAGSLLLRFVSFGAHFRYGDAAGIYGAFAIAVTAPALAWGWDARRQLAPLAAGGVAAVTGLALLGNAAIGLDSFLNNPQRNIPGLVRASFSPAAQERLSPDLAGTLAKLRDVTLIYTHYELEMFTLMMRNMRARYSLSLAPRRGPGNATLYSFPIRSEFGNVPVWLADGKADRLKLLGSYRGVGKELVFGQGALPAEILAQNGGYVVLRTAFAEEGARVTSVSVLALVGAVAGDALEYRLVQIVSAEDRAALAEWRSAATLSTVPTGTILRQMASSETGPVFPLAQATNQGFVELQLRQRSTPEAVWSTLLPLDRAADIVPPASTTPAYAIGQSLDFRAGGTAGAYLGPGWSEREASGTWSVGETSLLQIPLAALPAGGLRLSARVLPFLAPGQPSQRVTVLANDRPVAVWTFDRPGWSEVAAEIPAEALAGRRQLTLSFEAAGTVSPESLGASADPRPLKLLFERATLDDRP